MGGLVEDDVLCRLKVKDMKNPIKNLTVPLQVSVEFILHRFFY